MNPNKDEIPQEVGLWVIIIGEYKTGGEDQEEMES